MPLPGILLEEIELNNGLCLFIFDESRPMAGDRWLAKLRMQIPMKICSEYLAALARDDFPIEAFIALTGGAVTLEHSKQRNFIAHQEISQTLAELKEEFFCSTLPYISKPGFEARFAQKRYQDWCEEQRLRRVVDQPLGPQNAQS